MYCSVLENEATSASCRCSGSPCGKETEREGTTHCEVNTVIILFFWTMSIAAMRLFGELCALPKLF